MRRAFLLPFAAVGAFLACNGTLDVGHTVPLSEPGALDDAGGVSADAAEDGGTRAVWSGYIANFKFKSGADEVTATFTSPTSGTVVLGQAPDGADVVDPSLPRPAGCFTPGAPSTPDDPFACAERFAFTMQSAIAEHDRLRFDIDLAEFWATWCQGQTLITLGMWVIQSGFFVPASYGCGGVAPGRPGTCQVSPVFPDGGPIVPVEIPDGSLMPTPPSLPSIGVDCDAARACSYCACTAEACSRGRPQLVHFDLHVIGKQATGAISEGTVYLEEQ